MTMDMKTEAWAPSNKTFRFEYAFMPVVQVKNYFNENTIKQIFKC